VGFDGRLYFRQTSPDWEVTRTMVSEWDGSEYTTPRPYNEAERWKEWRSGLRVVGGLPGPDGRSVFLDVSTTNPATGRPGSDIWVSMRQGAGWAEPLPLGLGINSDGYDVFPFFSPDGRELYFVRDFNTFYKIQLAEALDSLGPPIELRYVANAGVLVTKDGTSVLIDAPIRGGIPPYATSDEAEREKLERALPPYDRVEAILITHWHEDHFSPEAVAEHLRHNPRAVVISSPEIIERVRRSVSSDVAPERFRPVLPEPGAAERVMVGQLPVTVLRLRHNPTRRLPEQHIGFLLGDQDVVLHSGDADPSADNFSVLRTLPAVDLALVPFWYVLTEANRAFVRETIAPGRIGALHLPPGDAENVKRKLAAAGVDVRLLVYRGERVSLPGIGWH
jgi:L-ascorbate metabolism protein UlaG (beta-lactamase superfamily)